MADLEMQMRAIATAAKAAAQALSSAPTAQKNAALEAMAKALKKNRAAIVAANRADLRAARKAGLAGPMLERLHFDAKRLEVARQSIVDVVKLDDPIGQETVSWKRPNGLTIRKQRLPLGVLLMIYESRPNVTIEASALALKSGNAILLRGGREAAKTNAQLTHALQVGLREAGLSKNSLQMIDPTERESIAALIRLDGLIDLCIPRGGQGLIRFVTEHARVPVVRHAEGVCHVFVHAEANAQMAEAIVVNAKTSRPGVCNAAECLLIDAAIVATVLPPLARALVKKGVTLKLCAQSFDVVTKASIRAERATAEDFGREFLALTMAVKVVDGLDDAMAHIAQFGSGHSEAIVTDNRAAARRFVAQVCASAVLVNASTRFNDGAELGLGAEIGISTSRLHAYGPMGLNELTAQKYVIEGDGQTR